jgi:hypothetical protein
MAEDDHPLLTKRAQGAIAVLALATGLGIALMSFHLLFPGLSLAFVGAAGAVWIYGDAFRRLRLRSVESDGSLAAPSREMIVVIGMQLAAIVAPTMIFIHELIPPEGTARHLKPDQRATFVQKLSAVSKGGFSYVYSSPSCDECERYAQELREAISEAPGWAAGGGPDLFGTAAMKGIKLETRSKAAAPESTRAISSALTAAKIRFDWIDDPSIVTANEGAIYIDLLWHHSLQFRPVGRINRKRNPPSHE